MSACGQKSKGPVPKQENVDTKNRAFETEYLGGTVSLPFKVTAPAANLNPNKLELGDTVTCFDIQTGVVTKIELFEFYENQE